MAIFCKDCGQPLPGTEERALLFDGDLAIELTGLIWSDGKCKLTKAESLTCMALARSFPRPASVDFVMDYLENCKGLNFRAEDDKVIDVFICKVRKKMLDAGCPFHIETTWGVGKQFAEGPAEGRLISASSYPRDAWKEQKHAERR
jgi:DNA-binding response OmpR family regulator